MDAGTEAPISHFVKDRSYSGPKVDTTLLTSTGFVAEAVRYTVDIIKLAWLPQRYKKSEAFDETWR